MAETIGQQLPAVISAIAKGATQPIGLRVESDFNRTVSMGGLGHLEEINVSKGAFGAEIRWTSVDLEGQRTSRLLKPHGKANTAADVVEKTTVGSDPAEVTLFVLGDGELTDRSFTRAPFIYYPKARRIRRVDALRAQRIVLELQTIATAIS